MAAASGGGASDPTIMRIIANTRAEGAYRSAVAIYEGEERARQLKFQAVTGLIGGADAEAEGATRQQGYALMTAGIGVKTASSLYSKYGLNGPPTMHGDRNLIDAGTPAFSPVA